MNITNPPAFDHVIFTDGISYKPFSDDVVYTGQAISALTRTSVTLAGPRDYRTCKNITVGIGINGGTVAFNNIISDFLTPNFPSASPGINLVNGRASIEFVNPHATNTWNTPAYTVRISGWAPA